MPSGAGDSVIISKVTLKQPFEDQKPGTSGLRKPVKTFQQANYTESFVQSILDALAQNNKAFSSKFIVGGDGRFYSDIVIQTVVQILVANGIKDILVPKDGIMSTPAMSQAIKKNGCDGGFILTASHNPGGPNGDFGIKYNNQSGGPAQVKFTERVYNISKQLKCYNICKDISIDIKCVGSSKFTTSSGTSDVRVIDGVSDYVSMMEEIFDFGAIYEFLHIKKFAILLDAMNGVTGPYLREIFEKKLDVPSQSLIRCHPKPDFGGLHPDPNLVYAKDLVNDMAKGEHDLGVAFDGDGDRHMLLGKNAFFVSPGDALAVLAANSQCIKYFKNNKLLGVARSMPTSQAVDKVAEKLNINCYEVPTGWKYFVSLLYMKNCNLCGEESFGAGSNHIYEKDGIWACLAWLSILAGRKISVEKIVTDHWAQFGRNYYQRYDYEECTSAAAEKVMATLKGHIGTTPPGIRLIDSFSYTDPHDSTDVARDQGIRVLFEDGSRIVYRLSGTGSSGQTIRVYLEKYVADYAADKTSKLAVRDVLSEITQMALQLALIKKHTGREQPTVIT